jgi:YD repeat-containing protein
VVHPDGAKESFLHDAEGRLLTHADPLGRRTEWRYTAAGLIGTRQDALGHLIRYRWDRIGRLAQLTNENGAVAEFRYDPAGKLLEEKGFDGRKTRYRYGCHNGRLEGMREGGQETRFEFDAAGRLEKRQSGTVTPDGRWNPEGEEEYQWDRNGRLALAKNQETKLQWFHDPAGNLVTEHQHYLSAKLTAVWRHAYDPPGESHCHAEAGRQKWGNAARESSDLSKKLCWIRSRTSLRSRIC